MTVADTFVVDGTKYAIRLDRAIMRDVGVVHYSRRRFGSTAMTEDITMIYKVNGEEVRRSTSTGTPRAGFWESRSQVMMDPDTGFEDAAQAGDSFEIVMRYEPTGKTATVSATIPENQTVFDSDGAEVRTEQGTSNGQGLTTNINDTDGLPSQSDSSSDEPDFAPSGATLAFVGLAAIAVIYYTQT